MNYKPKQPKLKKEIDIVAVSKRRRKVNRPPYDQLIKEIEESNYCKVGKRYGVSDNAVRKWVRFYEKYENQHTLS